MKPGLMHDYGKAIAIGPAMRPTNPHPDSIMGTPRHRPAHGGRTPMASGDQTPQAATAVSQRRMTIPNTLIHATNASPEVTLEWLRAMATTADNLRHARDVVEDCATQVGRDRCQAAIAELNRLENHFYNGE